MFALLLFLLFFFLALLALQCLMPAPGFLHVIPFAGKLRFLSAQFSGCQLFDTWAVNTHFLFYFPHIFKPGLQPLHGALLLLHLLLPFCSGAGQGKHARLLSLGMLQAGCLTLDQTFKPVFDSISLVVLGLNLYREGGAVLGFQGNSLKQGGLLCLRLMGARQKTIRLRITGLLALRGRLLLLSGQVHGMTPIFLAAKIDQDIPRPSLIDDGATTALPLSYFTLKLPPISGTLSKLNRSCLTKLFPTC
jgi:hypothetical protein